MAIQTIKMRPEEVAILLGTEESHFVDLKSYEIAPASLTKTISAFANAAGGEVYIGVEERITAAGIERAWRGFDNQEAANAVIQVLDSLKPVAEYYQAEFLSADGQQGLVLHIVTAKTRDVLFATNGKAYMRRSAQNLPVEGEEALRRLRK